MLLGADSRIKLGIYISRFISILFQQRLRKRIILGVHVAGAFESWSQMVEFLQFVRSAGRLPLQILLANASLRRRLLFELKHNYYDELDLVIPLGCGLSCPLAFGEAWCSFAEIFLEEEYSPAFEIIPLPERWIDLGCHAGFFSLFVAWRKERSKQPTPSRALLVDGDLRMEVPVRKMIDMNHFGGCMSFRHGLISDRDGEGIFVERPFMSSSACTPSRGGKLRSVPRLSVEEICLALAPPYDLIKVDVEGGEFELLLSYSDLLKSTRYLLLEWHSWHAGGGGKEQICAMAQEQGFAVIKEIVEGHAVSFEGSQASCGTLLFGRAAG